MSSWASTSRAPTFGPRQGALSAVALLAAILTIAPASVRAQRLEDLAPNVRQFVSVASSSVLIDHVRLIDGTGAPARDDMAVLIEDGRIAGVAESGQLRPPSSSTEVIDGTGHTLIPGLVMLHEHMFYPSGSVRYNTNEVSFPPLYLAGGTTTIRTGGTVDP